MVSACRHVLRLQISTRMGIGCHTANTIIDQFSRALSGSIWECFRFYPQLCPVFQGFITYIYSCFLFSVGKQLSKNEKIIIFLTVVSIILFVIGSIIIPLIIAYSPSVQPDPSSSGMSATD